MPALSTAALIACDPSCGADRDEREPRKQPTGVRATETIYTAGSADLACVPFVAMFARSSCVPHLISCASDFTEQFLGVYNLLRC